MSRKSMLFATALPVVGIMALVVRAELRGQGDEWRVRAGGYDPRDPISGHYLLYSYQWSWSGTATCDEPPMHFRGEKPRCCVCLHRGASGMTDPEAKRVDCAEVSACEAWLEPASATAPQKFFVPEEYAPKLEQMLRNRTAHIGLVARDGHAVVKELYLDGKPYRKAVKGP